MTCVRSREKGNHPSPFSSAVRSRSDVSNAAAGREEKRVRERGRGKYSIYKVDVILQSCTPELQQYIRGAS